MAIKVNGTTVIDDSRNLVNIASGAGSSTTYGDVGTYTMGRPDNKTYYNPGDTVSGLIPACERSSTNMARYNNTSYGFSDAHIFTALSGTWRSMNGAEGNTSSSDFDLSFLGLWVRIS